MNFEFDEMALICMGSITDSKKSMNYLKKQLRNSGNKLKKKKLLKKALNLLENMTQKEFEKSVQDYLSKNIRNNDCWE
jgi:hypothetical protein